MPRISSLMSQGGALWFCKTAIAVIPALLNVWEKTPDAEDSETLRATINAMRFAATSIAKEQLAERQILEDMEPSILSEDDESADKLKLLAEAVTYFTGD